MITTPYNFVPLNKKVVSPWWANYISHDIPFENAQSGALELTITAKSPIYVRNSGKNETAFNKDKNGYFIPGSSIKGMIRNVLEIMSFGNMSTKVADQKYSVRDFQNKDIYPKENLGSQTFCGWLQKVNGEYLLTDCGKSGRIAHKELDKLCGSKKISDYYKTATNIKTDKDKSSKSKNTLFPFAGKHRFTFSHEDVMRRIYKFDPNGKEEGEIVLTGQPSVRKEPKDGQASGKHLEFIFFQSNRAPEKVEESVIKNFFFAYYDHDRNQQKDDWKWRGQQLKNGEKIPVFFRRRDDGKGIKDIGLSYLYKITYDYSVLDSIRNLQGDVNNHDLSDCIFGYTKGLDSLKSRVHVSHARLNGSVESLEPVNAVLAGPKASYYPTYIDQGSNETVARYKTFMDKNATISGWKRYPVRNGEVAPNAAPNDNENILTHFRPLPQESTFKCTISYHNLRLEELGALISAITFHKTDNLFHSLGMAKPLGYGKVSVSIDNYNEVMTKAMKNFECFMNYSLEAEWWREPQLVNLLTMARGATSRKVDEKLRYMPLANFVAAKGRRNTDPKYALRRFNLICGSDVFPESLLQNDDFEAYKSEVDRQKFDPMKSADEIKKDAIASAKKSLESALGERKRELLSALKEHRAVLLAKQKAAVEEAARIAREVKKQQEALHVAELGIDFSTVDFEKNYKQVEVAVEKVVKDYALKLHKTNDVKRISDTYFESSRDIERTCLAVENLFATLPKKEFDKKKIDKRFNSYSLWIGEDAALALRKKLGF